MGRGSFQLLPRNLNPAELQRGGNLCSRVTNVSFCGSCDLFTGDPKKDLVVIR